MKVVPVLAALVAVVALTSVATAGSSVAKQQVRIDVKIVPESTFAFVPQQVGALRRDEGTLSGNWRTAPGGYVKRNGFTVRIHTNTWTLTGKRGALTLREKIEWRSAGNGDDAVALGTWKVVRGTGQYARVEGVGGSGHAGLGSPWYARFEGVLSSP